MMKHYESFIYGISFLALFAMSSQGIAGKGKWEILDPLSYPAKDVLNLKALDEKNLKGDRQILGIVEYHVSKHLPDSLQGKVVNDTSTIINADDAEGRHGVMVAQVAVSKHVGLAPDAKVLLVSSQIKIGNTILADIPDAIKFAIRNGADAINLSIMSLDKGKRASLKSSEGEATSAFLNGIECALNSGIPVFTSAGNDKEEIDGKVLESICETANLTEHPELLFIVGGFDYTSELFARKDVTFAEHSGRAKFGNDYSKFLVVGPYKIKVEEFLSIEDRKKELQKFRVACDAPTFIRNWTQDLHNALELEKNPELTARISLLLTQLEEQQLYLAAYQNNAAKQKMFKEIAEGLEKAKQHSSIGDKISDFLRNLAALRWDLMTGEKYIANQREAEGIFEERIMHIERDTQGRPILPEVVFELREVEGTSFASPAVASVYLRLNQYREQVKRGNNADILTPEDIAVAIKATAYKKESHDEGEEPAWYGCGIIDADAAFKLCKKIVQARLASAHREYISSADYWMNIFDIIARSRYPLPANYYFEILKAYKEGQCQRAEGESSRQALLRSFLERVLAYYPTYYAVHAQDRLEAALLYEQGKYGECKAKFYNILKEIDSEKIDHNGLDIAICNKAISTRILSESEKQVHLWFEGFLICETTRVTEQQKGAKIYFLPDPSGSKARYSITIRNGEKILKNLLTNIEHGLTQYDSLDSNEKSRFCYIARDILGLNVTGYSVNSIVDLPKGMVDQIEKLKVRLREMPDPL